VKRRGFGRAFFTEPGLIEVRFTLLQASSGRCVVSAGTPLVCSVALNTATAKHDSRHSLEESMRKFMSLVFVLLLGAMAAAQESPKAEVFGGYSYLRSNSNSFNGWEGQGTAFLTPNFGVTADVSGSYRNTSLSAFGTDLGGSAKQHLYNFLFGPTVAARFGTHSVFGHALFGAARSGLNAGVSIPIIGGFSTDVNNATAFAMALGGGVDLGVSPHFAIRPVQIDYVYTRFNSLDALAGGLSTSANGHQNSFRYSAGVVFRF
jgi:hypothetical protein